MCIRDRSNHSFFWLLVRKDVVGWKTMEPAPVSRPSSSSKLSPWPYPLLSRTHPAEHRANCPACGRCWRCGVRLVRPLRCARCGEPEYCGKECQRAAWPAHKRVCSALGGGFDGGPAPLQPPHTASPRAGRAAARAAAVGRREARRATRAGEFPFIGLGQAEGLPPRDVRTRAHMCVCVCAVSYTHLTLPTSDLV